MYDNRFFNGIGLRSAVYLSVVVVGLAISGSVKADVATPPPTAPTTVQTNIIQQSHGFPSTTTLVNKYGLNPNLPTNSPQVLKVPPKTTYGNATATTATKTNPIRITDPYGNVTKGAVTTQTQLPSKTTMSKTGGALMGVAVAGGALNSEGATIGSMIAQGDYTGAGQAAVRGVLNTLKGMGNFVTGGAISGVESAVGGYNAEKQKQTMAGAVEAAAQAKAEQAAAQAQAAQEQWQRQQADAPKYLPNPQTGLPQKYPRILKWWGFANGAMILPDNAKSTTGVSITGGKDFSSSGIGLNLVIGSPGACKSDCLIHWSTIQVTPKDYNQHKDLIQQALNYGMPKPTAQDFMLTADELAYVLQSMINQMLDNANANHTELINALAQLGALPANTPENTSVVGTAAENTFVSAPYTPAGTNQAQQTQHVVNRDGSITTSFIPRPDLGAHSSVAPTRTKIGTSGKTKLDIDVDGGSGSEQQKVEICTDKTDDTVMCLPAGSDDYEDLVVPEESETLEFEKKNYFSRNAACPAPLNINAFGMSMQMSYEPWCEMARGIRPIIEFLGVLTAMGIAYGAVREL